MRRVLSLAVLLCVVLVMCSPAMAAEREADSGGSPRIAGVSLVFDLLWKGAVPLIFGWCVKKRRKREMTADAVEAVEVGVTSAYEDFVRPLKRNKTYHPDGKLKEEERGAAKTWAINKAMEIATGGGRRLLVRWGAARIGNLVEKIIARRKKRKQRDAS